MPSKAKQALQALVPKEVVDVQTAIAFIKEHARKTFEETIEVHIRLSVDTSKSDQMVRGSVTLPGGAAKQKTIAVFSLDAATREQATAAGASIVGGEELVKQVIEQGSLDADIVVATPDMMPKLAPAARVLGPQGLMPSPKTGTVTADPATVVAELLAGKLSFKMDQLGNIHEAVGKTGWDTDKIVANIEAIVEAVKQARPEGAKGELIKSITLASTMGPGVKITV